MDLSLLTPENSSIAEVLRTVQTKFLEGLIDAFERVDGKKTGPPFPGGGRVASPAQ
ncbi:MAG: hypothetical protein AVDCRST_MAG02-979 [uncultured Rubrobacteraceae bacterium]|uniref:Uncharacterized protein n=1 Tax=uncultured Rubrobacteraceae bacterium TaxID=349277 RepID=A0A6J4QRP3_9ACTN|nr:MAG: hypothetical protein AVDCRST_MAG02-979 [uncultured Rubrobacteraceae bacterium]